VFGGGVLGCAKDYVHCCGLLGGGSTIAWGGLRFSVFFFFFSNAGRVVCCRWWGLRFDLASNGEAWNSGQRLC